MGAVVTKGPGVVTICLGVVKISLAGHPTIVVLIPRGTLSSLLPLNKVGIQQQGAAVGQANSISNVNPAGLGQGPMLRLAPTAVPPGARSNF